MNAIEIVNVTKTFKDGKNIVKALDNVSLRVNKGEILGLLGANGAGKTTLISILIGLLSKDKGKITILGKDIDKELDEIKPRLNLVSGFTMVTFPLTVTEYLRYFSMLYDIKEPEKKIKQVIKQFGLEKKAKTEIRALSAGFKQRVMLAKALLNDAEIIFMDEPTVGLDVNIAIKIRAEILDLKKRGTTIIFTSHNLSEVEQLCDRIALISAGKIVQVGSIQEIKQKIKSSSILEIICNNAQAMVTLLKKEAGVKKIKIVANKIFVEAKDAKHIDSLMKKAVASDNIVISIRLIEPTLEEAFLKMTSGE